ncbi:UNVERIFIED_CONTAM: hypothetical protein FKN15_009619 [Acipenser sinensis]
MVIVSQVKNRGVLQVLSEEVSLKEAPECGQGLGGPDIYGVCYKVPVQFFHKKTKVAYYGMAYVYKIIFHV